MPQVIEEIRDEWTDSTALEWISGNFRWPGGVIRCRAGYIPTEKDMRAVRYMCDEWDFAYNGGMFHEKEDA